MIELECNQDDIMFKSHEKSCGEIIVTFGFNGLLRYTEYLQVQKNASLNPERNYQAVK